MMARAPVTITLGEKSFSIRPLTLGQVEQIEAELSKPGFVGVGRAKAIIKIGLSRDHTDTAKDIDDLETEVAEVSAAMGTILRQGGFVPDKPGEERAAPSTGETSEAA